MSYAAAVAHSLHLRGPARERALKDLTELVTELKGSGEDPEDILGDPHTYAAALDAEFGVTGAPRTLADRAISAVNGLGRRLAGTFDPADTRLLVPRVLGLGWDLNMGAVATRLGLLRPDDVDNEILDLAVQHHSGPARAVAGGATAVAALAAAAHAAAAHAAAARATAHGARSGQYGTHPAAHGARSGHDGTHPAAHGARSGQDGTNSAEDTVSRVMEIAVPVVSAALLAGSSNERIPSGSRLMMPALAGTLSMYAAGSALQALIRPGGRAVSTAALLGGAAMNLLLGYLPVRSALQQEWSHTHAGGEHEARGSGPAQRHGGADRATGTARA